MSLPFEKEAKDFQQKIESLFADIGRNIKDETTLYDVVTALSLIYSKLPEPIQENINYNYNEYFDDSSAGVFNDRDIQLSGKTLIIIDVGFGYKGVEIVQDMEFDTYYTIKLNNVNNSSIPVRRGLIIKTNGFSTVYLSKKYSGNSFIKIASIDTQALELNQHIFPFKYSNLGIDMYLPASVDNSGFINVNNHSSLIDIYDATLITKTLDWTTALTLGSTIWTPASGKKFVITDIFISVNADTTITLYDNNDSTTYRILKLYLTEKGGLAFPFTKPRISTTANNSLKIKTDSYPGTITVNGYEL